ncbi:MAG TPA: TfoX/Sxy family protein [Streptosporangiaceae bacterium]|nr:TfoX/Sxy family protein [Streptosporangiaceae bacterium]
MAYDEDLAARIRELVTDEATLSEKKMFGGLAFLIGGNMAIAASGGGGLMVRVDPDQSDALVSTTSATVMVMRGRPMSGWLYLETSAVAAAGELEEWVGRGVSFARSLPPKR